MLSSRVKDIWQSGVERISDTLSIPLANLTNREESNRNQRNHSAAVKKRIIASQPTIVFVLSLAGRFQTFLRFLENYEHICLMQPNSMTELLVVLFQEKNIDLLPYYNEVEKLQRKYPQATLNHLTIQGNFSRGIALNQATHSEHIQMDDIIFFIDVDIIFERVSLERIRLNTIKRKQVYLPIVFSQYNPNGWNERITSTNRYHQFVDDDSLNLDYEKGYFRQFGYGICAIYKIDILHPAINGFDTNITGWGLEDVKFLEKIINLNIKSSLSIKNTIDQVPVSSTIPTPISLSSTSLPLTLAIFRAPDPTLVHVYHDIYCDKTLNESQYFMCLGTKANTFGSYKYIESIFINNRTIIDYIAGINKFS